ncbi:bifunctional phosphoribosyl-AMP cyclohydrolase/phosphoribosyl-ATP diphosphatase HisIE [Effusibacillus lacus]|uniref:Histidine biosynthesis bifunctional protein HisIE n=1 Tax=Effusibacillus lacus TaxID=1348429 RepID=A0A292YQN7_9BACL|nr:bifunctional phosphoribosyl-AMP cyclohydrolase/phosphoribosyl-ATP diphosphatase HisIE [Effusibacillus lacus]TCS74203.1 phosphoribosyl-ATP pyrophosphatase /phosphoribosyl-AMP cyclohydrolase [Effusibacillus lacus]GAX90800.1 bifunctional phosphoribosyl-AMP cyclohydrolase/phosphoribosyl-ATP diphosphatase [Effusibacillus lacus]
MDHTWIDSLKFDERGLIPAVIQDVQSNKVLMVAYMNRESLVRTVETGQTWFWSRSRNELWNKGATSGHVQQVQSIAHDCDRDTLLIQVKQTGFACHTGAYSCFYETVVGGQRNLGDTGGVSAMQPDDFSILAELVATIDQRYKERPEGAYTTYLFEKGLDKILKKVGEEATEVVVAAKNGDAAELTSETGDLIYHLLVLLKQQGVSMEAVLAELEKRHGVKDIPNKTK